MKAQINNWTVSYEGKFVCAYRHILSVPYEGQVKENKVIFRNPAYMPVYIQQFADRMIPVNKWKYKFHGNEVIISNGNETVTGKFVNGMVLYNYPGKLPKIVKIYVEKQFKGEKYRK